MKRLNFICLLCFTILIACSSKIPTQKENALSIATFNVEWLGDGVKDRKDRSEGDYKRIADVIIKSGADIIACQEIENQVALGRVAKYLPEFKSYVAKPSGAQNIGVLYKSHLNVDVIGNYDPIAIDPKRNRPGLELYVKAGNFDFSMMIVHLKSTSRYDDTEEKRIASVETRLLQAKAIKQWVDEKTKAGKEQDYIILGDYNDAPKREKNGSLGILNDDPNLEFITKDLYSCGRYSDSYTIDNILVSKSALSRCFIETLTILDITQMYTKEQLKQLSDHCPVIVQFDVSAPDND